jgi:hypothetical protein
LPQIDFTVDPTFGAQPGDIQLTDVPLTPGGDLVVVSHAFIVENDVELAGDYNLDGRVNTADYIVWRRSREAGVIGANLAADGYNDGVIDHDDYIVWRQNFGDVLGGGAQSIVPEPAALALVIIVWVGNLLSRSRRRAS